jgi:hypothetical protein
LYARRVTRELLQIQRRKQKAATQLSKVVRRKFANSRWPRPYVDRL